MQYINSYRFGEVTEGRIVISQIYGGGGRTGATYTHDFIELHNVGGTEVDVSGYSVQYTSAAGTSWQKTNLTGSIPAGGYYLIQGATSMGGGGEALPTPEVVGSIAMSTTAGKVLVRTNQTTITFGTSCPIGDPTITDFVGYGETANCFEGSGPTGTNISATTSVARNGSGCDDTDDNAADFSVITPSARNGATAAFTC